MWARDPDTGNVVKYGDVRLADELQFSVYNFELADVDKAWKHFELCEIGVQGLLDRYAEFREVKSDLLCTNGETRVGTPALRSFA